jgi:hypothetical protein
VVDYLVMMKEPFSIISAVNEALALSNERQQLLEMVLDTLLEVLEVDCCWVQLLDLGSHELQLVAHRGFTPDMEREIGSPGLGLDFTNQISGLGYKIIIPDLSHDKDHVLTSFINAELRSLVAVPLRTYHTQGVIGIASKGKQWFNAEAAELLMVIASMVGTALDKADLYQRALASEKQLNTSTQLGATSSASKDEIRQEWGGGLEEEEKVIQSKDVGAGLEPTGVFCNGRLWMSPAGNEVRINGRSVALTAVEYKLLYHLASNEGKVISYKELLTEEWDSEYLEAIPLLRMRIQHLKQKLGYSVTSPGIIIEELDGGYRFVCQREKA